MKIIKEILRIWREEFKDWAEVYLDVFLVRLFTAVNVIVIFAFVCCLIFYFLCFLSNNPQVPFVHPVLLICVLYGVVLALVALITYFKYMVNEAKDNISKRQVSLLKKDAKGHLSISEKCGKLSVSE